MELSKDKIIRGFGNALHSYDEDAKVQQSMSNLLFHLCSASGKDYGAILEIGVGTGTLTKQIVSKISFDRYYLNDIVSKAVDNLLHLSNDLQNLSGDIENIDWPENLDLIISGSTFQWLSDLKSVVEKAYVNLKSGGEFIFQTFGPHNLHEIKLTTNVGLDYIPLNNIIQIMHDAGFEIMMAKEEMIPLQFESPLAVLVHLKKTGVSGVLTHNYKLSFKQFEAYYNDYFKLDEGVKLTYHPLIIHARKNG